MTSIGDSRMLSGSWTSTSDVGVLILTTEYSYVGLRWVWIEEGWIEEGWIEDGGRVRALVDIA